MGRTHAAAARAGITLDAGALIALDRGDKRLIALLARALAHRLKFRVPAGVVGQAWRDSRVQVALARFLRIDEVEIVALDEQLARVHREVRAGRADFWLYRQRSGGTRKA